MRNSPTATYIERELLVFDKIIAALDKPALDALTTLEIFPCVDSTNQYLWMQNAPQGAVCLAEYQSDGRGQQGRRWLSPYASGISLSLSWHYTTPPQALSLALGVGVAQVLEVLGAQEVGLKWSNDVMWRNKKLAGLLIESRYVSGAWRLVIGLGLNVYPIEGLENTRDNRIPSQMPTDLTAILGTPPSRNQLAAALITRFLQILCDYPHTGFAPYEKHWQRLDILKNQEVTVFSDNTSSVGIARGVDAQGALLLETAQGTQSFVSASVRL